MQRGSLNKYEKSFLKGGVVFKPIKLAVYGMRADELEEKEHLIKSGKLLAARPVSAGSAHSKGSGFSMSSHNPHGKQYAKNGVSDLTVAKQPSRAETNRGQVNPYKHSATKALINKTKKQTEERESREALLSNLSNGKKATKPQESPTKHLIQ